jgi:hypothetical protein
MLRVSNYAIIVILAVSLWCTSRAEAAPPPTATLAADGGLAHRTPKNRGPISPSLPHEVRRFIARALEMLVAPKP